MIACKIHLVLVVAARGVMRVSEKRGTTHLPPTRLLQFPASEIDTFCSDLSVIEAINQRSKRQHTILGTIEFVLF